MSHCLVLGCGGAPAPEAPAAGAEPSTAESTGRAEPTVADPAERSDTGEGAATGTSMAAAADRPAPAEDAAPTESGGRAPARDVKYLMSPDGLRVEVEGVAFVPTARAVRAGKHWNVEVQVEARATDEATHSLLVPKGAELAFAAKIRRADGRTEQLSDRREDDTAVELAPAKTIRLARAFPGKPAGRVASADPAPLGEGDELELEVGIWGVGRDAETRRPLNQLSTITFKFEKGKPRVKVAPPKSASR